MQIILHAFDVASRNCKSIQIRTVDSDVVVIAVAYFKKLTVDELWVAFESGTHFRYIAAHEIAVAIGNPMATVPPLFHAVTLCHPFLAMGRKLPGKCCKFFHN